MDRLVLAPAILCVTLLVAGLLPYTGAQHSVTNFVYGLCNTAQYSSNDSFAHNLNTVVGVLTQGASKALYALAKSESGPSNDSYVYAMYQCRGDVSLSACSSCVSAAFNICGPALGARGQFEGCFVRYENYNFSADISASILVVQPTCSAAEDSSSLYQRNLASALNSSASAAPRHALFGYSASSVGTGSSRAFALTQCLGYVSPSQCAACLAQVSNYSTLCNRSVSGQVYYDQCYYIFNHTSFLFTTTPAPASSPSPAPASSRVPSPSPAPVPVPTSAPAPAPVPVPSTPSSPPPPTPVSSPPQPPKASTPSGSQETSKKGNTIISIVVTLMASSFCVATLL